jgi:hypothetical protein
MFLGGLISTLTSKRVFNLATFSIVRRPLDTTLTLQRRKAGGQDTSVKAPRPLRRKRGKNGEREYHVFSCLFITCFGIYQ